MQIDTQLVYPAAATLCSFAASVTDVKSRRVPNLLTGPAFLFGLMLHFTWGGWKEMLLAAVAGLICGVVFLLFYLAGGMGAGDVKLIAAVGCIAGLPHIASVLVLTALAGGVMALVLAAMRGRLKETLFNVGAIASHHRTSGLTPHPELNVLNSSTLRLPYALAIAAGCTLTLFFQVSQR